MTTTLEKPAVTLGYKYTDENKEHLHSFNGKPLIGTSTVCKIIGSDGAFTWWASGKALELLGWKNKKFTSPEELLQAALEAQEKVKQMSPEEYAKFLQACYSNHKDSLKESAEKGTDMHAELEKYAKFCIREHAGIPQIVTEAPEKVLIFSQWAAANVNRFLWSEGHCYSTELWTGGISDVGAEMKNEKYAVLDYKSSKDAYYNQFVQAAGYAKQIEENGICDSTGSYCKKLDKPIEELYIVPFGASDPTPRPHFDVEGRKEDFRSAVRLYKGSQIFNN